VSPILVRPVREQFEHDRVIRVLQAKYKRKYEVAINPGSEQNAAVGIGDLPMYPDLVLFSQERNRKIHGTVEVETTESINTLEAMAEWGPFSRLRTPFFLYVPANTIDTVRRLCSEHAIDPAEIWTYHTALDQLRFTMVHRSPDAPKGTIAEHKPKPAPVVKAAADTGLEMAVEESPKPAAAARLAAAGARPVVPKGAKVAAATAKPEKTAAPKVAKGATTAKAAPIPKAAQTTKVAKAAKAAKPSPKAKAGSAKPTARAAKAAKARPVKSGKPAKSAKAAKKRR
jgi:hypothetical protein